MKEKKRKKERDAKLLFVHRAIGMNVSTIHENYGRDPHYDRGWSGGEVREETQTDNAKKSRKIGRSAAP